MPAARVRAPYGHARATSESRPPAHFPPIPAAEDPFRGSPRCAWGCDRRPCAPWSSAQGVRACAREQRSRARVCSACALRQRWWWRWEREQDPAPALRREQGTEKRRKGRGREAGGGGVRGGERGQGRGGGRGAFWPGSCSLLFSPNITMSIHLSHKYCAGCANLAF